MKVTEAIHAVKIPFKISIAPEIQVDRVVFAYFILGEGITLIDSGVSGAESVIFDHIKKTGRAPHEISTLILTHSHPDHIGSGRMIKDISNCKVFCHPAEKGWIEDVARQAQERPVPGFNNLVGGSIPVDGLLQDGDLFDLQKVITCRVLHTPGHSAGSISLFHEKEKVLFSGDAIPVPGDLPLYDDIVTSMASLKSLKNFKDVEVLLSSWEPPIRGRDQKDLRIESGIGYLRKIHNAVLSAHKESKLTGMALCKKIVANLGLPPFAVNPLLAKAFTSSLDACEDKSLSES